MKTKLITITKVFMAAFTVMAFVTIAASHTVIADAAANTTTNDTLANDATCVGDETQCACPVGTNDTVNCVDDSSIANSSLDCNGDGVPDANCTLVTKYLNPFIKLLSFLVGTAVVVGIVIGAIQYSASGGDPQKTASAKKHIRNAIIALLAYIFLFAFLRFLTPGIAG